MNYYTLVNLNLEDGKVYYLSVKAIDNAGNESVIGSSDGITVDTTPPELISITDEGEYTTKGDGLHFQFLFEDKVSGIAEYQYAIGTSPGGSDVVLWKPTTKTEITETNLNLTNGKTYYLTVKAKNKAGLWSRQETSDGIKLDTTPPSTPVVVDDGEETTETTALSATFSSLDNESGIIEYQYAIGTGPGRTNVIDWTSLADKTRIGVTGLNLSVGETYYINVKARNKAGLWSEAGTSAGITIAETPVAVIQEETTTLEVIPPLPTEPTPLPVPPIPSTEELKNQGRN